MWVLMLEAFVAFFLLVFIVWWTMYQGKGKGNSRSKTGRPPTPERKDDRPE